MNARTDLTTLIVDAYRRERPVITYSPPGVLRALEAAPAISEEQLSMLLDQLLPGILAASNIAVDAYKSRRLTWGGAVALGTTLAAIVGRAVAGVRGLGGTSPELLLSLIWGVLFDRLLVPLLPAYLRPLAPLIRAAVAQGLGSLYHAALSPRSPAAP